MKNLACACAASVLLLTACGVGDDGPTSTPDPRLCTSNYDITGTFTLGMPAPDEVNNETGLPPADGLPDVEGCWPTGTWTFTLAAVDNTCATTPTPQASYSFRTDYVVVMDDPVYNYTLITPSLTDTFKLKVSEGGGGLCEATLEIFEAEGKNTWNLHPVLDSFNMNGPLTGKGEFAEWSDSQNPFPGGP